MINNRAKIFFPIAVATMALYFSTLACGATTALSKTLGEKGEPQKTAEIYHYSDNNLRDLKNIKAQARQQVGEGVLSLANNPFGYTGEYTDSESGLVYLDARYYDPVTQQFMSKDSYFLMNRYGYGEANPIANIDPSGHLTIYMFVKSLRETEDGYQAQLSGYVLPFKPGERMSQGGFNAIKRENFRGMNTRIESFTTYSFGGDTPEDASAYLSLGYDLYSTGDQATIWHTAQLTNALSDDDNVGVLSELVSNILLNHNHIGTRKVWEGFTKDVDIPLNKEKMADYRDEAYKDASGKLGSFTNLEHDSSCEYGGDHAERIEGSKQKLQKWYESGDNVSDGGSSSGDGDPLILD